MGVTIHPTTVFPPAVVTTRDAIREPFSELRGETEKEVIIPRVTHRTREPSMVFISSFYHEDGEACGDAWMLEAIKADLNYLSIIRNLLEKLP